MVASRSSSKFTKKLNLQPVSNIKLFPTHTTSKLSMLGIAAKACDRCSSLMEGDFEKIIFCCPNRKRPLLDVEHLYRH
jgi:hypothetical protein